ncbi:MAG: hypothetical protein Athens071416_463 [Parcubacteria group bacterium Athens0714_16]|nr:MAG: hypothetical protein Athens071416_463 [Parcubacteria group bacterium Athens0714_16]
MKKILYVGVEVSYNDSLTDEIRFTYLDNLYFDTANNLLTALTKLRRTGVSCLLFDDISLGREQIFSCEETNDNRTTVIALIKTLSENKKFDPKKIVVKMSRPGRYFEKYRTELFEQRKKELINYGVATENIFEKPASNKKVADAVVKILNNQ